MGTRGLYLKVTTSIGKTGKTKLTMLAFFYCRELVKTSFVTPLFAIKLTSVCGSVYVCLITGSGRRADSGEILAIGDQCESAVEDQGKST